MQTSPRKQVNWKIQGCRQCPFLEVKKDERYCRLPFKLRKEGPFSGILENNYNRIKSPSWCGLREADITVSPTINFSKAKA